MQIPITPEGFTRYLERNKSFHRELWRLAKSPSLYRELEHICKIPFAAPETLVFSVADCDIVRRTLPRSTIAVLSSRLSIAKAHELKRSHVNTQGFHDVISNLSSVARNAADVCPEQRSPLTSKTQGANFEIHSSLAVASMHSPCSISGSSVEPMAIGPKPFIRTVCS